MSQLTPYLNKVTLNITVYWVSKENFLKTIICFLKSYKLDKDDKFCLLHINENIIERAKIIANLDLMPVCLPSVEIEHGSACFTTSMSGYMKREKNIHLNLFKPETCTSERYFIKIIFANCFYRNNSRIMLQERSAYFKTKTNIDF